MTKKWSDLGLPKSKIIIGIATFGRGYKLSKATNATVGAAVTGVSAAQTFTKKAGIASFYEICNLVEKSTYKATFDVKQQASYANYSTTWFGYNNVTSVNATIDFVVKNKYGGVFAYTMDMDDFSGQCPSSNKTQFPLLNAILVKLEDPAAKAAAIAAACPKITCSFDEEGKCN